MSLYNFLKTATKTVLNHGLRSNTTPPFLSRRVTRPHAIVFNSMSSDDPSLVYEEAKIVPDVVSTHPKLPAEIRYEGAVVNMGNELTPTMVKNQPSYVHWPVEKDTYYTLCMTDPDAPSRQDPKFREFLHWLVVNIRDGTDIKSGNVLAEYIGAAPPQGTGLHRYVFLVYKQKAKVNYSEWSVLTSHCGEGRGNFKIEEFAEKYELGFPIAGNFFHARWDAHVTTIEKHIFG